MEECPVDPQFLRKCVDSIMKLDQKSKVKVSGHKDKDTNAPSLMDEANLLKLTTKTVAMGFGKLMS